MYVFTVMLVKELERYCSVNQIQIDLQLGEVRGQLEVAIAASPSITCLMLTALFNNFCMFLKLLIQCKY